MFFPGSLNKNFKTEGTSQTHGQLVTIPFKKDVEISTKDNGSLQNYAVSPNDILVKIIPNENESTLADTDKSKISIAAFSDNKDPTVAINSVGGVVGENLFGGTKDVNFATVSSNENFHAIVLGSALKPKEEVKKILTEARKIDLMITCKSKDSEEIEFNNLKEIEPEVEFFYNFFIPEEEDTISQEDQTKDPLLKNDIFNVPRYVELRWKSVGISNYLNDNEANSKQEIKDLKREAFTKDKGVVGHNSTNFKNSFEKYKKKAVPRNYEGSKVEVTDIHKLDSALDSTSNKKVFANTINAVFNVDDQNNVISSLPIFLNNNGNNKNK